MQLPSFNKRKCVQKEKLVHQIKIHLETQHTYTVDSDEKSDPVHINATFIPRHRRLFSIHG